MKRTIHNINGRRALRRARKKSKYKRRKENELKYEQFYKKEKESFFDTTEEFFNFLFGAITVLLIFISILRFAPELLDLNGFINAPKSINNRYNYTNTKRNYKIPMNEINKNDSAF